MIDRFIFKPARAARETVQELDKRMGNNKIGFGTSVLDSILTPLVGGDVMSVVARPGMGKTLFMLHMINHLKGSISKPLMYATWETSVSEFVALRVGLSLEKIARGSSDRKKSRDSVVKSIPDNVVVFSRDVEGVPNLADLKSAIPQVDPGILLIDYLQRIPARGMDRSQAVSENLEMIKDMALSLNIPIIVAVQARREVDSYAGLKMPGLSDSQWSSNVEQTSDKVISLTRPIGYIESETLTINNNIYKVDRGMVVVNVVKQRWSTAGQNIVLSADFNNMVLSDSTPTNCF